MSDTDKDDVLEHLRLATNHEAGLIPTSTQILLLSVANERDALQARVAELEGALSNVMGHVDTPIGRRRLNIPSPHPEWLIIARQSLKEPQDD